MIREAETINLEHAENLLEEYISEATGKIQRQLDGYPEGNAVIDTMELISNTVTSRFQELLSQFTDPAAGSFGQVDVSSNPFESVLQKITNELALRTTVEPVGIDIMRGIYDLLGDAELGTFMEDLADLASIEITRPGDAVSDAFDEYTDLETKQKIDNRERYKEIKEKVNERIVNDILEVPPTQSAQAIEAINSLTGNRGVEFYKGIGEILEFAISTSPLSTVQAEGIGTRGSASGSAFRKADYLRMENAFYSGVDGGAQRPAGELRLTRNSLADILGRGTEGISSAGSNFSGRVAYSKAERGPFRRTTVRTRPTYEQWDDGIGEFGGFDYSDEGAATMTDGGPELTPETIGNIAKNGSNRGYFQKAIEGGRAHQASLEILDTITSSSSEGSRVIDDIAADIARDAIEGLKSNVGNLDGTEASQQKRVKERSFELTQEWYDKLPENAKFPENDLVGSGVKQGFSYNQRGDYFEYIISKEGQIYDRLFFGNSGDLISINFDQKLGDRILERLTRTFTTRME